MRRRDRRRPWKRRWTPHQPWPPCWRRWHPRIRRRTKAESRSAWTPFEKGSRNEWNEDFLDAFTHLYKRVCPSVRGSVTRFFNEPIMGENGRKWQGTQSHAPKFQTRPKVFRIVPKCLKMSQKVQFRRIVVRTDLCSEETAWPLFSCEYASQYEGVSFRPSVSPQRVF